MMEILDAAFRVFWIGSQSENSPISSYTRLSRPLMTVRMPESVAEGIEGKIPRSRSCCLRLLIFATVEEYHGLMWAPLRLDASEAKTDRKAVRETMHTATHVSTSNQKTCQIGVAKPSRMPGDRIQAMMTMQMLKHKNAAIFNFRSLFILTCHKILTGILMTKALS